MTARKSPFLQEAENLLAVLASNSDRKFSDAERKLVALFLELQFEHGKGAGIREATAAVLPTLSGEKP